MSKSRPTGDDRKRLLLEGLEAPQAVLTGEVVKRFGEAATDLGALGILEPRGYDAVAADEDDRPVELVWSSEADAFGYFSGSAGWVSVSNSAITSFAISVERAIAVMTQDFNFAGRSGTKNVVEDSLWDLGSVRLGRPKPNPVLFSRRVHEPRKRALIERYLRNVPTAARRILLTSTIPDRLGAEFAGCFVISLWDVLSDDLRIPPDTIALRLEQRPAIQPDEIITLIADGKEVVFKGDRYHFVKGLRQRAVIKELYVRYRAGEYWVSSAEVAHEAGLSEKTRIRDAFKDHPAWGRLLTEREGMCGFCFDEEPARPPPNRK
jgi:hypothetical protein